MAVRFHQNSAIFPAKFFAPQEPPWVTADEMQDPWSNRRHCHGSVVMLIVRRVFVLILF